MSNTGIPDSVPPPNDRFRGIPRLIYLGRILNLCFFPLATVLVGDLVILYVPQVKEALLAFSDDSHFAYQAIAFETAYILWMISAWYVARLLVGKRFEPDLVGTCSSKVFAQGVAKHLPRLLALIAGLPLVYFMLRRCELRTLGIVSAMACVVVFTTLVFRRDWGRHRHQKWIAYWHRKSGEDIERFDSLSAAAWIFIGVLFAVSCGLSLALPWGMAHIARWIGAPALLLFALMSWTIFGGFILTYLPKSFHIPALTWIAALLLFVFFRWNENHPVAPPAAGVTNRARPPLEAAFVEWLRDRPDSRAPVIFVASAGGASRAAYWTTSALGKLEDDARSDSRAFADNIFVISGVSGGSLGAASFVTTLDLLRKSSSGPCKSVQKVANSFTARDHLATVAGMLLFPDLLQRFLPIPLDRWDRSRGLEEVWASDWSEVMRDCGGVTLPNPWEGAFTALYPDGVLQRSLPAVALNSTALNSGRAVLQAPFTLNRSDAFDLLDKRLATQALTLAQAVHNSARFPYISPAGVVRLSVDSPAGPKGVSNAGKIWDRLGDGGYVEASGALTLTQIIQELRDNRLIRTEAPTGACAKSATDCYIGQDQLRVIILDNAPTYGGALLCEELNPRIPGERQEHALNTVGVGDPPWPPGPDFLAPVLGAFSTRDGRSISAQIDLRAQVGGCGNQFAELRFPAVPETSDQPAMDWMLNRTSRKEMDAALEESKAVTAAAGQHDAHLLLQDNLAIVRTWFWPPKPQS